MITNGIIPISQALKEASAANADSMSAVYLFIYGLFISLTICYLAANSSWRGAKRINGITAAVFLVASFMTQIETWFFVKDFPLLTVTDMVLFTIAPLPSIIVSWLEPRVKSGVL